MRLRLAAGLLLITAAFAGCIGNDDTSPTGDQPDPATFDKPSPKRFEILPVSTEWVTSGSGTDEQRIHNAVYRPDTNESVPVFINFSPYWGDTATQGGDNFAQYMINEYVPRGYAVVLSAIRGTGHSEGCFQIGGDLELDDLNTVVDHFANQDWSNGKIIAGGKSYDSTPQNGMIAKTPHPALEGLFHVSGITDMYRYNYRMGVPYSHGAIFNTYYYLQGTDEYGASLTGSGDTNNEDADSLARAIDDAACTEFPETQTSGIGSGAHGLKDAYWLEREWTDHVPDTDWNGSIFFVHGLQDWNVKPDHILPWLENLPEQIQVKGWLHQDTEGGTGHVYPMRADWNQTMLAWMDHELKGKTTNLSWGFDVESSDDTWRQHDTWPPKDADPTAYPVNLTAQGDTTDPTAQGTVLEAGNASLRYAGEPTLTITATSTTEDPVLIATLYEEDENGTLEWANQALLRGIYRDGLEEPTPITPREPITYNLTFYPQDDVLDPGHAWILTVGETPRFGTVTPAQRQAVTYDTDSATLRLPLVSLGAERTPQPTDTPCFAC